MAVSSSSRLLLLLLISSLDWLSAFLMDWDHVTSSAPHEPHFTQCISRDQETFRCWWSPGSFHNLSSPGALRVFYLKKDSPTSEWKECPKYIHSNRECFFDMNHTSVWIPYCMQLRSQDNVTYFNEGDCFTVENIVRPDPPVSLNWTLLNISPSWLSYDIMVNWDPPPSADVGAGWMRVEYEIQYRERNKTNWETLEMQQHTQQTIYGLSVGKEYEVKIRCRMLAFTKFGQFSDSIFVQVPEIPSIESTVQLTLALVFGTVGIFVLVLLIVLSQQHRLMMVLLPPVPAPKIKGIDPELLKKGKLDELNFILSGGGVGGLSTCARDFYQDEPWVEFIEVDPEDADASNKEDNQDSDTQRLLGLLQPTNHHMNVGGSSANSFPNGAWHTSSYNSHLSNQDTLMLMATLLPGQPEDDKACFDVVERDPTKGRDKGPVIQAQSGRPQTWVNTDFYAQVSNVMPSGGVVLSPGQQLKIESAPANEEELQNKAKDPKEGEDAEEKTQSEQQFQLLVVDPEGSGYAAESSGRQINTPPGSPTPGEGYQTIHPQPAEIKPAATAENNQSSYILPDSLQTQVFAPVADYTVVHGLDNQHSVLLDPPPQQSPPPCRPQHPLKALPAMPVGYVTPELLGNFSP